MIQNKGSTSNDASMAFGFQRTQFYAPGGTHGTGWGDGKARRWLVDEFLKEGLMAEMTCVYTMVFFINILEMIF